MTPQQFADDLVAKSCKTAKIYDKSIFESDFIKGESPSLRCILCNYQASHPKADSTDIAFHAAYLFAIQAESRDVATHAKDGNETKPF